ncbi:MAG: GWxTD domain-containing protein [Thermoanaerobaculia bacterium]
MRRGAPLLLLLALLSAGCGGGGASGTRALAELINPALGPEYSFWMAGAVSRLATPEEINQYITLRDDAQAQAFIEAFWQRRDPSPERPGNPFRETFERRAAESDRLYSEGGILGRRTDRGILNVLYGPPEKVDHDVSPVPNGPPLEVWTYGAKSPSGLDGKRPAGVYRFIKNGELTVRYAGAAGTRLIQPSVDPEPPL